MKKLIVLFMVLTFIFVSVGCAQKTTDIFEDPENNEYIGLNAKITDIDTEKQIVYVTDFDGEYKFFGEKVGIYCENLISDKKIFRVLGKSNSLSYIDISDFEIGDHLVINVTGKQLNEVTDGCIYVDQIQLND